MVSDVYPQHREGQMTQRIDVDRLFCGGSLYPPPDDPVRFSARLSVLIIVLAAVAAWALVVLVLWPVLR